MGSVVLTVVLLKTQIFCDVKLCRLVKSSRFLKDRGVFETSVTTFPHGVTYKETLIFKKKLVLSALFSLISLTVNKAGEKMHEIK
jgi:hypothetical protein